MDEDEEVKYHRKMTMTEFLDNMQKGKYVRAVLDAPSVMPCPPRFML